MENRKLVIGLFGFGVVGEGIYNVLQGSRSLDVVIKGVCIKDPGKQRNAPSELFTNDAAQLLDDEEIDLIVELIDDPDAAYKIVRAALCNKKSVVTANKKMLAHHLSELIALRDRHGVSLLYEAAVCGSVPIIRNLEEYYDNDMLSSVSGVINGSTNYILSRMTNEGLAFEAALEQAQALGFAESDPTLDVEGIDAINKLTIILKHAYGINEVPDDIPYCGISQLRRSDIRYAKEKNCQIKLVAQSIVNADGTVSAFVLPTFVNTAHQLFHVHDEFNGVLIGSKLADEQFLYGKGAGRYPTSSAVLSDIAALRYGYRYEYKKSAASPRIELKNDIPLKIYVSFDNWDAIDQNEFLEIEEIYKSAQRSYLVGAIDLDTLFNTEWFYDKTVSVVLVELHRPGIAEAISEYSEGLEVIR